MLTAITAAAIGAFVSLGAIFAQVGTGGGADTLAPIVQTGGTTVVIGALVYMARQMIAGNLVAKPIAEVQSEMAALVQASFKREERFADVLDMAHQREQALANMVDRHAEALGRAGAVIERAEGRGV